MDRAAFWTQAFRSNQRVLGRNVDGLTDEMAQSEPAPGVTSPAWALGHMVYARQGLMALIGSDPQADPAWKASYARATPGGGAHLPLSQLVEAYRATEGPLTAALAAVADWQRPTHHPALGQELPLEEVVSFMCMHESYHLGQFGIFRKLLGLGGAL